MKQSTDFEDIWIRVISARTAANTVTSFGSQSEVPSEEWNIEAHEIPEISEVTGRSATIVDNGDLHAFKELVVNISNDVLAIRAELGEDGERHITTFVSEESDQLREKIIASQAQIILTFPDREYSFHIRVAPRKDSGELWLPDGSYCLLTWEVE